MKRIIPITLFLGGIVLTGYGINAIESITSDISKSFAGLPEDKAVWMIIGGVIMIVTGLVAGLFGAEDFQRNSCCFIPQYPDSGVKLDQERRCSDQGFLEGIHNYRPNRNASVAQHPVNKINPPLE